MLECKISDQLERTRISFVEKKSIRRIRPIRPKVDRQQTKGV